METNHDNSETYQETMLQIGDALVSLDLAEEFFCCDLDKCLGECCIEGDAGAPITPQEEEALRKALPQVWDLLLPRCHELIEQEGVAYTDEEGDRVTQIIDGRNCVFSTYGEGGMCLCALEKAYREGRCDFCKPISCALYPLRLTEYPTFTAVNYHKWDICKAARLLGRSRGIRLYEFLREPLIRRFGSEWYDELTLACRTYLEEYGENSPSR